LIVVAIAHDRADARSPIPSADVRSPAAPSADVEPAEKAVDLFRELVSFKVVSITVG